MPWQFIYSSAWSIVAAGAKPIFCDVNEDMLISVEEIKKSFYLQQRLLWQYI